MMCELPTDGETPFSFADFVVGGSWLTLVSILLLEMCDPLREFMAARRTSSRATGSWKSCVCRRACC